MNNGLRLLLVLLSFTFLYGCGEVPSIIAVQTVDEGGYKYNDETEGSVLSIMKIMDISDYYDKTYQQSLAVYGNYAFVFSTKGGCRVVHLPTGTLISETRLGNYSSKNHANNAVFSSIMYETSDVFPLLYVSPLVGSRCDVERFNVRTNTFSVVQTIKLSTTEYNKESTEFAIDNQSGLLYAISFDPSQTKCHVRWFSLPSPYTEEITLTDAELLGSHEVVLLAANVWQGVYVLNGKMYLLFGGSNTERELYVIDLRTFFYKNYNFSNFFKAEPEGIAPYNGYMIINSNFPGGLWRLLKY